MNNEKIKITEEAVLEGIKPNIEKDLTEKDYSNVKKLKCDYDMFKRERNKCKMRVPEKCEICKKKFEKKDSIYVAFGKSLNQIFICEICATKK